jgi:RNase P/RNase MRP subunit POP5
MKPLIPSHRERKRYLLLKGKDLKKEVPKAVKDFIGVLGLSEASLNFVKENVLCINRKALDKVKASFAVWPKKIEVLKVSGTLKGLK